MGTVSEHPIQASQCKLEFTTGVEIGPIVEANSLDNMDQSTFPLLGSVSTMTAVWSANSRVAQGFASVGSLAVVTAPLVYRAGVVAVGPAFLLLLVGVLVVIVTIFASLITAVFTRHGPKTGQHAVRTFVASAVICLGPLWSIMTGLGTPPIHDITTDTEFPPKFVAVVPLNTPNRTIYEGETIAAQQRNAYPDLEPVILNVSPDRALAAALAAVDEMGWKLVSTDTRSGQIEATDTTFWFGFKDDVVIRVQAATNGSRVDVRSLSRVGGGDAGANAKRIRRYVKVLIDQ